MRLKLLAAASVALMAAACAMPNGATPSTPTEAAAPAADHAQLLEDLRILSADDMQGRDTGSEGGAKAREYIVSRLEALGVQAPLMGRLQPWEMQGRSPTGPRTWNGTNIIGLIPGTRASDKYIVLTAHYDHVGVHEGQIYNGADDNASGVATVLEIAQRLKAQAPEHSVLLVFFDGEERGLLGARHFVEAPPVPLSSIALNLNLDMISRPETDNKLWAVGTYQHPNLRPLLESIAPNGQVSLVLGKDTPQDEGNDNWVNASDHAPFHAASLPFIYLGVNYHPDYHRPSDDFDKVIPAMFGSAAELSYSAFRALDRGLSRQP